MCACVVLPLNSFSSASLILIYGQFLLTNGAWVGFVAGFSYTGIEKNSMDGPSCYSAVIPSFY